MINSVANHPHFHGRLEISLDVHVRIFEIACTKNNIFPNKQMEIFATILLKKGFYCIPVEQLC